MPSHITDSIFLKDLYGTDEMRAVFDDRALLQKWLDVEVALARAEAELGVIPPAAAEEIARKGKAELIDTAYMKQQIDHTLHPIVPLIRAFKAVCEGDAGEYIHWGATTQDIMDTAIVLQIKDAMAIFERRLAGFDAVLSDVGLAASRHADGRPHARPARAADHLRLQGRDLAGRVAPACRAIARMQAARAGGAVRRRGRHAGRRVGDNGLEIQRRMMAHLGLRRASDHLACRA